MCFYHRGFFLELDSSEVRDCTGWTVC